MHKSAEPLAGGNKKRQNGDTFYRQKEAKRKECSLLSRFYRYKIMVDKNCHYTHFDYLINVPMRSHYRNGRPRYMSSKQHEKNQG